MGIMLMLTITIYGITALCFLQLTSAAVINESYSGYLFTVPDQPDNNTKTKIEAQRWCQSYDSVLLEIYDSKLQQTVESFINKTSGQQPSFGIRNMFTNGVRTGTPWMWVNGNGYSGVDISNQLNSDYVYGYLLFNQTGLFFSADNMPANKRSYICKGSISTTCGFRHNGVCFESTNLTLSWYDARSNCLNSYGDLASFDFVTDQQSLNSLNGSWISANTPYWIGLQRQRWMWQHSGLEIKYTHWQNGHPQPTSGDCLCLLSKGDRYEWTECNCDQSFQFICMRNIAETSLSTTSSTKATVSESGSTVLLAVGPSRNKSSSAEYSQSGGNAMRLGVGIGVGVGGLLIIIVVIVVTVLLIRKRRHKKSESSGISSSDNKRVEMTSTPAYESLQNRTTTHSGNNSNSTYQELNIIN